MKLLILITHYFVLHILSTVSSVTANDYLKEFIQYLVCEMPGSDPNDPCHTTDILSHPFVATNMLLAVVFYGISPIIHLMFVLNLQKMKEKCMQLCTQCGMEPGTGGVTGIELSPGHSTTHT